MIRIGSYCCTVD